MSEPAEVVPDFPVNDQTLTLVEMALDATTTGQTSLGNLLDLLSGFDASKLRPVMDGAGRPVPDVEEYPDPLYSEHDLIRALIAEVRRLRAGAA